MPVRVIKVIRFLKSANREYVRAIRVMLLRSFQSTSDDNKLFILFIIDQIVTLHFCSSREACSLTLERATPELSNFPEISSGNGKSLPYLNFTHFPTGSHYMNALFQLFPEKIQPCESIRNHTGINFVFYYYM